MAILQDLRNRIFRKHDPLGGDAPGGLAGMSEDGTPGEFQATETAVNRALVSIETKPSLPPSKPRSLAELQHSYDEVMQLVRKIGDHLDDQSVRHERVQEIMERLPPAVEMLPEINRQNARLLDVLTEYLDQARTRESTLNDTLTRITESSSQQTEVLGLLRQQLSVNNQSAKHITDTLGDFRQTLRDLGQSNTNAVEVLAGMAAAAELRESKLESMVVRSEKWMIAVLVCCGAAAIMALGIAIL